MTQASALLAAAEEELRRAGDEAPALVARLLLASLLQKDPSWLYAWPEAEIHPQLARQYRKLVCQRRRGVPVAYLTGTREFWSLELLVDDNTLIPRPETELLVETALDLEPGQARLSLLDLGTGSGAIAVAIASERPQWQITAIDRNPAALRIAERNAKRHHLENIHFQVSDWFADLGADRRYQVLVSNPPYIAAGDPHLHRGDLRYEPDSALIGGRDGLEDLRRIIATAPGHLTPGGWLLVEHGHDQAVPVRRLFQASGFGNIHTRKDLQGNQRLTMGQR